MPVWKKRPLEVLQYTFDFAPLTNSRAGADSDWLASGELITGATVTTTSGLTVDTYAIDSGAQQVTCRLSGGTAGQSYWVTCEITTDGTQTARRDKQIQVVSRYT